MDPDPDPYQNVMDPQHWLQSLDGSCCSEDGGSTEGRACAAESHLYDAVVASEVIEHVENPALFLQATAGLLKEGGSIFLTTINRTSR